VNTQLFIKKSLIIFVDTFPAGDQYNPDQFYISDAVIPTKSGMTALNTFTKLSEKHQKIIQQEKQRKTMTKRAISTNQAPAAIGPYSQAIAAGNLIFISGQLPIDPTSGKIVDGDIGIKTRQIVKNAQAIAEKAGTDLNHVVKTTIFLTDLADFQAVNAAYGSFFTETPPARSTVQVAGLPLGSNIEIEFILSV
jgi:2-iminobutanoate/2-iminopropanoate deaminase